MLRRIQLLQDARRDDGGAGRLAAIALANRAIAMTTRLTSALSMMRDDLGDYRVNRDIVALNQRFENAYRGRRAFILGTGPSLQQQDLSKLGGELTFAVNSFWKHPVMAAWQPTFYCLSDPVFFDSDPDRRSQLNDLMNVSHRSTFFFPAVISRQWREQNASSDDATHYVSFAGWIHNRDFEWPALHKSIPSSFIVVQLALMVAMYMGCNPIYLLGCDHDFAGDKGRIPHFHQGPVLDASLAGKQHPLSFVYEYSHSIWKGYERLLRMANSRGVSIFNATAGGMLDVFDRADYDSLFR
jgi:hypothetical protein